MFVTNPNPNPNPSLPFSNIRDRAENHPQYGEGTVAREGFCQKFLTTFVRHQTLYRLDYTDKKAFDIQMSFA